MDWDDVRLFLELTRRGSARAAASELGISHSTIVRRVDRLETNIGARLFDRDFTGYRPTAAGETLIESALAAEEAILTANRQLQGQDAKLTGEIHLTTPDIIATYVLIPELSQFSKLYPDIELTLSVSYDVFDLARREADVAIRVYGGGRTPPEDLVGRKLVNVASCYYASEAYLADHDPHAKHTDARWIGWGDEERFPAWVKESPFPHVPAHGHFENGMLQAAATVSGMGIASLPCFMGEQLQGVVRIPGCEPYANYDIWMLSHPDLRDAARHRTFRQYLADAFAKHEDRFLGR